MQNDSILSRIRELAEEVTIREGCTLYDLEFVGGGPQGGRTLRVYIDKTATGDTPAEPTAPPVGVSIEDCTNVSRGLNLRLDVEDVIPGGAYSLEVSSPGLERVLRVPWHFEKAIGKTISLKSFAPLGDFNPSLPAIAKARTLEGELKSVDEDGVKVLSGEAEVFVPFKSITKAHLVYDFAGQSQSPKNKKAGNKPKGKRG